MDRTFHPEPLDLWASVRLDRGRMGAGKGPKFSLLGRLPTEGDLMKAGPACPQPEPRAGEAA